MDKRDLHKLFQDRLTSLIQQTGQSKGAFAETIGIDRSALSQMLDGRTTRLPRVETMARIAECHNVSMDWLTGLSETGQKDTEVTPEIDIEQTSPEDESSILASWREEAIGQKIRYIPFHLPELFCLPEIFDFLNDLNPEMAKYRSIQAEQNVSYFERPETDLEIVMSMQTLKSFAAGRDIWEKLPPSLRRRQIEHLARAAEELYPTVRMYLIDGRRHYAAPVTIFGNIRSAFYLGDNYLVLTGKESIRQSIRYFDSFIRKADIHPHEFTPWVKGALI